MSAHELALVVMVGVGLGVLATGFVARFRHRRFVREFRRLERASRKERRRCP